MYTWKKSQFFPLLCMPVDFSYKNRQKKDKRRRLTRRRKIITKKKKDSFRHSLTFPVGHGEVTNWNRQEQGNRGRGKKSKTPAETKKQKQMRREKISNKVGLQQRKNTIWSVYVFFWKWGCFLGRMATMATTCEEEEFSVWTLLVIASVIYPRHINCLAVLPRNALLHQITGFAFHLPCLFLCVS